ncbi:predicted protein [Scheffersomyces stipitis CBS 6054]|uniref:Anaphase-promoting complex subunit 4 n=1 Tax=Scheffersomyces stipitis (strain ATCC 58785 / CBS 6054 / NBRC 10063 / NRRL Y-11545) TaxID=322104 RepID=A3LZH7_PICST|nr:predicted protein [Scheffersomyces stipitis CBS 6054]ABN68161.2 predicted protein [Scheffersomyces stipitis CBS 6054]KAG2734481.1 hypothetical protein G9P44_002487 [Scheffersomyces stipitis]
MTSTVPFSVVSQNKFMGFADGNIIKWFPTLNLLAVSMNKMSIWVYRLNGERIYSVNNKSPINSIGFIRNGAYFCLGGLDGLIKIHDSNNGQLIKVLAKTFVDIKLVDWSRHEITFDGKFDNLFQIDILNSMPKLNSTDEVLSTVMEDTSPTLNYLVVVDSTCVSIIFNNFLTIDEISFPQTKPVFLRHLDSDDLFNQYFLTKSGDSLQLLRLRNTLGEDHVYRKYFVNIISKLCKLMGIIDYIHDQLALIQAEIKPLFVTLDRYLSNLKDSLGDDTTKEDLIDYFVQVLLTNLIPESTKDFWLNQFGERGFKRILKLGNSTYDSAKEILFSQLIASVERMIVILNEISGLSQWLKDSECKYHFGLDPESIALVLDKAKELLRISYRFIWDINEEKTSFNTFMEWVKIELIDKLAKEDDMEGFLDLHECFVIKESKIMNYIEYGLFESRTWKYLNLDLSTNEILNCSKNYPNDIFNSFDELKKSFRDGVEIKLSEFIRQSFYFDTNICPLDVPLGVDVYDSNTKLTHLNNDAGLFSTFDEIKSRLFLVGFSFKDPLEKVTKSIYMDTKIIGYDFRSNQDLVLLLGTKSDYEVCSINLREVLDRIEENIEFNSIKKVSVLHQNLLSLKDPKLLRVNQDENSSYACVLDSNRQNYVVLGLGS